VTSRTNEIKVGITIIVATALLYTGFRFMKDRALMSPDDMIHIKFAEVTGLATGRAVYMNGVDIGKVQKIVILPDDSVLVSMNLRTKIPIPANSVGVLKALDILGTKAIEIVKGTSPDEVPEGGFLKGVVEMDAMASLMNQGTGLTGELGSTVYKLNSILGEMDQMVTTSGSKDLKTILDRASRTTDILYQTLNKRKSEIDKAILQLESITANTSAITKDNKKKIDTIITNLEKASGEMDEMTKNIAAMSAEMNTLLKKINKGEGTLGKLANDASLYNHMDSTLANLNALIKDLKANPKKYTKDLKLVRMF
jgi:phospholipid/cholesterol/gamma-HCH transport system substrate-binding protein